MQFTDALYDLFARYNSEKYHLDADEPVEHHLLKDPRGRSPQHVLERTMEQLERALGVYDGDDAALGAAMPMRIALPLGASYHAWSRYLLELMPQIVAKPGRFIDQRRFPAPLLPRVSRFDSHELCRSATNRVIELNQERCSAWLAQPEGLIRLHLYADIGHRIGDVMLNSPEGRPDGQVLPVSACVTVLRIRADRTVYIEISYPEIDLPRQPRLTYPDLSSIFGGYFHQDFDLSDESRIGAERNLNLLLSGETRQRVSAQIEELLTEDDDTMRRSVEALGSYVLPHSVRRWVSGIHRRMTRIDWDVPWQADVRPHRFGGFAG